jgi:hypothetical protein
MIERIEFYVQPNDAVNKRENVNQREKASTKGENRLRLRTPIP